MNSNVDLQNEWKRAEKYLKAFPGILAWLMLLGIVTLSFVGPEAVAYVLLVYALYWVFRSLDHVVRLILCFFHVQKDTKINWLERCELLERDPEGRMLQLDKVIVDWWADKGVKPDSRNMFLKKASVIAGAFIRDQAGFRRYIKTREELVALQQYSSADEKPDFGEIRHLVIIPTYKEGLGVLKPTFEHILRSNFPLERVYLVLATEEADPDSEYVAEYARTFFRDRKINFFVSRHQLVPGEVAGKSANQAYAIKWFNQEVIEKENMDTEHLLVTSLDADYRMHSEYFANLSYKYLTDPERKYHMFQPIPMFFNNIWQANMFSRVQAASGTQIQMARQMKAKENRSWSSYAVVFPTLQKAGYWDKAVIQEDSRLYWRIYFAMGEKVRTVRPLFLPVYGDAVQSPTYIASIKSLYQQLRRWAWGASDVPYVLLNCIRHKEIPLRGRIRAIINVITEYFNWATLPVILALGTVFPLYFSPEFGQTVMAYNLPLFTSRLLTATSLAIVFLMIIDAILTPPQPQEWNVWKRAVSYTQWLTIPVIGIVFGALPALDAQSRLMLGKKLEYQVTEKGGG